MEPALSVTSNQGSPAAQMQDAGAMLREGPTTTPHLALCMITAVIIMILTHLAIIRNTEPPFRIIAA